MLGSRKRNCCLLTCMSDCNVSIPGGHKDGTEHGLQRRGGPIRSHLRAARLSGWRYMAWPLAVQGEPIGFWDDRHICLVSGTRGGKGTTCIIPNLCLWPGSIFVIDPKGENANTITARRETGSDYSEGMEQKVMCWTLSMPLMCRTITTRHSIRSICSIQIMKIASMRLSASLKQLL